MLKLGSLFSGSGGFELAGMLVGIEPVWSSEIEPFPVRVTTRRMPFVKHFGDINDIHGGAVDPVDIITFGSPCFPAGTLVLTVDGYLPIERICVGMKVLTHKGRWRTVTAAGKSKGKTVVLSGNHYGLECTANHPIYSAEMYHSYPTKPDGKRTVARNVSEKKEWTPAGKMAGKLWAVPHHFEPIPIPMPQDPTGKREKPMPPLGKDLFYFTGRWIGDGWTRDSQRPGRPEGQCSGTIIVCGSKAKEQKLKAAVEAVTERYSIEQGRTGMKYKLHGRQLCTWLTDHFGKYAYGKRIPAWAFSMPCEWRAALLQGIFDTDGHEIRNDHWSVSTVSRSLAHGMRLLGESLGYSTSVYDDHTKPFGIIEGRPVHQRPSYTVRFIRSATRKKLTDKLHSWYPIRDVRDTGETREVFNLSVEEDESYIAEGAVVHNCQDMSLAGRRAGLDGKRSGLFHQAVRIVKEMREKTNGRYPRFIVWENVTGAFSSNKGRDFQAVLTEIARIADEEIPVVPLPDMGRWPGFGALLGDGWSVAYRTFDAQYWGVPQRRRRIYLVADFAGGRAAEILSEPESLSGHPSPGREAWQRFALAAPTGTGATGGQVSAGFCTEHSAKSKGIGWQEEIAPTLRAGVVPAAQVYENHGQDTRFIGPLRVAPTVMACYGTGGNNQPFVVPVTLKIRSGCEGGGKGALMQENKSATLSTHNDQTLFEPTVYGISSDRSHAMLSGNPRAGIYEASTSRTIDTRGGTPACNQGGMAVVEDVYAVIDGGFTQVEHEKAPTLMARDFKGPVFVNQPAYSVRRLTPTECARLQGFPDDWCSQLGTENPSTEELALWRSVFDTHSRIFGKRAKTDNQIRKWLRDPYTDSAEYKMWGNGIALPCAVFVLEQIVNNS